MKKYLAGLLTGLLISGLATSALAISGRMTIEVDPIDVQVNGAVFQPTDVNGNEVPVFAYNGTTYAPLRALAEAYGLEVGYDAASNMATVADPEAPAAAPDTTAKNGYSDWSTEDEAAYQEFKGLWTLIGVKEHPNGIETISALYTFETSNADVDMDNGENLGKFIERFTNEIDGAEGTVTVAFKTPNGYSGHTQTIEN